MNEAVFPSIKPVLVIGESLVDVVDRADGTRAEHPGGSPMNVALGLGRLDVPVLLMTRLGDDRRGDRISGRLERSAVRLTLPRHGHTSTARAIIDASGGAEYAFDIDWDLPPSPIPSPVSLVHFGSLGAALSPGAASVEAVVAALSAEAAVSYDPNMRPRLEADAASARRRVEAQVRMSTVVKASDEDLRYLYPNMEPESVAQKWLGLGPALVVVTLGSRGMLALTQGVSAMRPAAPTRVVDTIGAGDSVMSAILARLVELGSDGTTIAAGLNALTDLDLEDLLAFAAAAAAVTVGRAGAEPPIRAELTAPVGSAASPLGVERREERQL